MSLPRQYRTAYIGEYLPPTPTDRNHERPRPYYYVRVVTWVRNEVPNRLVHVCEREEPGWVMNSSGVPIGTPRALSWHWIGNDPPVYQGWARLGAEDYRSKRICRGLVTLLGYNPTWSAVCKQWPLLLPYTNVAIPPTRYKLMIDR